ncbi:MAG: HIT family protein [Actinomycetia bacterium]|nr:HIT family protein [Actinomycetes bacterium]
MAEADCAFCAIVSGGARAHEVCRGNGVVAFLDHSPLFEGHVLVVPDEHFETLADLPTQRIAAYFAEVQRISAALPAALGCTGSFVAMNNIVSQSVPHLHTHVVPRTRGDGLRGFFWPRTRYESDDSAARTAAAIATTLGATRRGRQGGRPQR